MKGRRPALTDEQAEEIREQWKTGEYSQKFLASLYNVHYMTIFNVIHERGPYGPKVIPVGEFKEHMFYGETKG